MPEPETTTIDDGRRAEVTNDDAGSARMTRAQEGCTGSITRCPRYYQCEELVHEVKGMAK